MDGSSGEGVLKTDEEGYAVFAFRSAIMISQSPALGDGICATYGGLKNPIWSSPWLRSSWHGIPVSVSAFASSRYGRTYKTSGYWQSWDPTAA